MKRMLGAIAIAAAGAACAAGSTENDAQVVGTAEPAESKLPPPPPTASSSSSVPPAPPPPPPPPPPSGSCTPPVPGGACDTLPQCGCLGASKCDVADPSGRTACVPDGPAGPYAMCGATTDCQAALSCVDGVCKPFCDTPADCSGGTGACIGVFYGASPVPGFSTCTAECDLVTPSASCGMGASCYARSTTSSDCAGAAGVGTGPGGCPSGPHDCAPGYVCISGTVDCKKWCRIGGSDCATCAPLPAGAVTIRGVSYGVCG